MKLSARTVVACIGVLAVAPTLVELAKALVPLVIVVGVIVAVVRAVFFATRSW